MGSAEKKARTDALYIDFGFKILQQSEPVATATGSLLRGRFLRVNQAANGLFLTPRSLAGAIDFVRAANAGYRDIGAAEDDRS